jgi:hypothetical protein
MLNNPNANSYTITAYESLSTKYIDTTNTYNQLNIRLVSEKQSYTIARDTTNTSLGSNIFDINDPIYAIIKARALLYIDTVVPYGTLQERKDFYINQLYMATSINKVIRYLDGLDEYNNGFYPDTSMNMIAPPDGINMNYLNRSQSVMFMTYITNNNLNNNVSFLEDCNAIKDINTLYFYAGNYISTGTPYVNMGAPWLMRISACGSLFDNSISDITAFVFSLVQLPNTFYRCEASFFMSECITNRRTISKETFTTYCNNVILVGYVMSYFQSMDIQRISSPISIAERKDTFRILDSLAKYNSTFTPRDQIIVIRNLIRASSLSSFRSYLTRVYGLLNQNKLDLLNGILVGTPILTIPRPL